MQSGPYTVGSSRVQHSQCAAGNTVSNSIWMQQVLLLLRLLLWLLCSGYEAETVAAADRSLKDSLGPLAYVVAGAFSTNSSPLRQVAGFQGTVLLDQVRHGGCHSIDRV